MPPEQSEVEYHQSQKRVQQWVQKTSQELETGTAGRSSDLSLNKGDSVEDAGRGNSSGSRRRESERRRTRRLSSSSKPHIQNQGVDNSTSRGPSSRSRSTRKKAKTNFDVRPRNKLYSSDALAISSLLSFGLFPLIFVLTPPSVATIFSALILLAGYLYMDYGKKGSSSEKL